MLQMQHLEVGRLIVAGLTDQSDSSSAVSLCHRPLVVVAVHWPPPVCVRNFRGVGSARFCIGKRRGSGLHRNGGPGHTVGLRAKTIRGGRGRAAVVPWRVTRHRYNHGLPGSG